MRSRYRLPGFCAALLFASLVLSGCDAKAIIPRSLSGSVMQVRGQVDATVELTKMGLEKAKEQVGTAQSVAGGITKGVNQINDGIKNVYNGVEQVKGAVGAVHSSSSK